MNLIRRENMLEYKILWLSTYFYNIASDEEILNECALKGWELICVTGNSAYLKRLKQTDDNN